MEQFALLQEKARVGESENDKYATKLYSTENPELSDAGRHVPDWDIPLYQVAEPSPEQPKLGSTDDERAYFNAISSQKRSGEDASVEHLERKSAKSKRARMIEESDIDGVKLTSKNVEFNARLQ